MAMLNAIVLILGSKHENQIVTRSDCVGHMTTTEKPGLPRFGAEHFSDLAWSSDGGTRSLISVRVTASARPEYVK